jgi:RNA polymerase sigma-70 factor (ECF subfamily)
MGEFLAFFSLVSAYCHSEGDALDGDHQARVEAALRQAARGDEAGFAELVREHQAMVFSIAWHYLQDRSLAEDVAQEVFLELYQKLAAIQSAAHLKYWLRKVSVHRAIDQGRRRKHRRESHIEDMPETVGAEVAAGAGAHQDPMLMGRLRQVLAGLPEKQRMMVLLRYQEDLGPAEISELLEVPVNTVKSTLHRSLEELRGRLTRKLGEVRYAFF